MSMPCESTPRRSVRTIKSAVVSAAERPIVIAVSASTRKACRRSWRTRIGASAMSEPPGAYNATRRDSGVAPVLCGTVAPGQVARGVDQPDVRERLREVADLALEAAVVLLGQQADVVAQREQALED